MSSGHRLAVAFGVLAWGSGTVLHAWAPAADSRLDEGFELAYNLDYDAAVDAFRQVIAARPEDRVCRRTARRLRMRPYTGSDVSDARPARRHRHGRRGRR